MKKTLLPISTQLEENLSLALRQAINFNFDLRLQKNALTADKNLLVFLSLENSVDYTPAEASEQQQRTIINQSLQYHKIKGTIASLKLAIAPFGKIIKIEEWLNNNQLKRGTMQLEIEINDKITEKTTHELTQIIKHTKRASIHLANIFLVQKNKLNLFAGIHSQQFELITLK